MAACSLLFPGLFLSPLFEMVSLSGSSFLLLPSLHFHPFVVSALILYLRYNVSCALKSCSRTVL